MEHLTITLACRHIRYVTLDINGRQGSRVGRAAQLARAFLKPCLICQALAEEQAREDEREYQAAIRITKGNIGGNRYAD